MGCILQTEKKGIVITFQINTLLEIWRDYREETSRVQKKPRLPEPPGHRERLIQEIQFFVDNVKEKAKNQGV